jgi:AraC family transcriptional regulator
VIAKLTMLAAPGAKLVWAKDRETAAVKPDPAGQSSVDFARPVISSATYREAVAPRPSDEHFTPNDETIVTAVLVRVLGSTHGVLDRDRSDAAQFISWIRSLICAEMGREGPETLVPTLPSSRNYLAPWQARRVFKFIEANLGRSIKLQDLAASARLSVSYFSRAFHADFGMSPYDYVIRCRIRRAQEVMLVTDKPLAAIAIACGLADQAHFTRLFHRIVGTTPARWRRSRCLIL